MRDAERGGSPIDLCIPTYRVWAPVRGIWEDRPSADRVKLKHIQRAIRATPGVLKIMGGACS